MLLRGGGVSECIHRILPVPVDRPFEASARVLTGERHGTKRRPTFATPEV